MPRPNIPKTTAKHSSRRLNKTSRLSKINLSVFVVIFALVGTYIIVNSLAEPRGYNAQPFSVDYIESTVGMTNIAAGTVVIVILLALINFGVPHGYKSFRADVRKHAVADPNNKSMIMPSRPSKLPAAPLTGSATAAQAAPQPPKPTPPPKREDPLIPGTTILPTESPDESDLPRAITG